MTGLDIKIKLIEAGVKQYSVAAALGMSESALSKKLREPLSDDDAAAITKAIEEVSKSE